MTDSTSRSARTRRAVIGVAAGFILAIGAPLAASAHVHVTPETAAAGSTESLTFSFSHGCDGSPTTALAVDIPDGVGNATPVVQGGWTITRELGADGVPDRVVYTADAPVEDGLKAAVAMDVLFTEGSAQTTLAFPVTQTCAEGETAWTQVAGEDEDPHDLESPAPVVAVGSATDDADSEHDAGAGDADSEHDTHAGDAADTHAGDAADAGDAASVSAADPVARWLAAGGLAAGIAALAVVLVRGRRKA